MSNQTDCMREDFTEMSSSRNQSLTYDPDSIRPSAGRARSTTAREHAWILCRNLDETPVPDIVTLQCWAERGRVKPDDYLVNSRLDTCVQAREMLELKVIFRQATVRRLEKISSLLAWGWQQFSH